MEEGPKCIYCRAATGSLEHPLPAAFGEFENAPLLEDRICKKCNNERLGILDEQLARCGPEAFFRRHYGVEGRANHEPVNPYYRGSAGGRRLDMKAFDEKIGLPILLEGEKGKYRQARQLIFVENVGDIHHLPLRDGTTPEQLRDAYEQLGVKAPADLHMVYGDGEEWVPALVEKVWSGKTISATTELATTYQDAVTTVTLTNRYFRAIAKIGFHYFLTQFPQYRGDEPMFDAIRAFILDEKSTVEQANVFVGKRQHPLLGEMLPPGARPGAWRAHILAAETEPGFAAAHVQMFLSEDWAAPTYTVRLAHYAKIVDRHAAGHAYVYHPDGQHGDYAGFAHGLGTSRTGFAVPPLAPVVLDTEALAESFNYPPNPIIR